jgi:peptidoglycan hydrolase-like protein with peptidoglycan-binding domain
MMSRKALVAGALLAGFAAPVSTPTSVSASVPTPTVDTTVVSYHGYRAEIPATWRVVDLARNPAACARFDTPAVYLGHPGDQSTCPARLPGRTAGLIIEPLDSTVAERITDDVAVVASGAVPPSVVTRDGSIQVAVETAGVLVTALHAPDAERTVRSILTSARLTTGGSAATTPQRSAAGTAAVTTPQPGTFRGKGFDACTAPPQSTMDKWLSASPYRAIGVYISGGSRACAQPNLTASWVSTQVTRGWRLIPIDVGRQAPCTSYSSRISSTPATARSQGGDAAATSVRAAQALGIPPGSAIYSDIEGYTSTASCRAAVLSYLSGWTEALHGLGYLSGVYSSASSGIRDASNAYDDPGYTRVDHIWFAWWNNVADTNAGSYVPSTRWADHQRIHQYAGDVSETWGGATLNIDRNFLDVAAATPEPPTACLTVTVDFTAYPALAAGATGGPVRAAQCLLENSGHQPGADGPTGTFDAGTVAATRSFQQARGLPVTGTVDSHTWTALLAFGDTPLLQNGSTGPAVNRLQRALTAALSRTVTIDGRFGPLTEEAVRNYQTSRGLSVDGAVGPQTWTALQTGR